MHGALSPCSLYGFMGWWIISSCLTQQKLHVPTFHMEEETNIVPFFLVSLGFVLVI